MNDAVLALTLGLACYTDLKERMIPDTITYAAILYGLISHYFCCSLSGLALSAAGICTALVCGIVPFLLNALGGGDVKLLAAIGAIKGHGYLITAEMLIAIVGGIAALIYTGVFLAEQKPWTQPCVPGVSRTRTTIRSMLHFWHTAYMPYAPAIAAGVLIVYLFT